MAKTPLEVIKLGGINASHTRDLGNPSDGKNFITKSGSLKTRPGSSALTGPASCTKVESLHAGAHANNAHLLLEEGANLALRPGISGDWVTLKSDLVSRILHSCRWQQFIILGNGDQMMAFDTSVLTNGILTSPAGAVGSTKPNVANGAFTFYIEGTEYSKAANAVGTAPGNDVIPLGKFGAVRLDIGADGTLDVIEATDNATGYNTAALAEAGLPDIADAHQRVITVTASKSDGAFTFGTTNLDAANTTVAITSHFCLADLGGTPPDMSRFMEWNFRPFGWDPESANPHLVWYSGYDANLDISKDVWPADYNLNIGGSSAAPVLDVIPFGSHAFALTTRDYKRIYGVDETNLEIMDGESIGGYGTDLSGKAGNAILWVGSDKKIYLYSGTQGIWISSPIDELLADESFAKAFSKVFGNQFWLIFTDLPSEVIDNCDNSALWVSSDADFLTVSQETTDKKTGTGAVKASFSSIIEDCDTAANWVPTDPTNFTVSQETSDKQQGTGAVKITGPWMSKSAGSYVDAICEDNDYIYVGTNTSGYATIYRIAKAGGAVTSKALAYNEQGIQDMAQDTTYIYAVLYSPAKVIRLLKSDFSTYNVLVPPWVYPTCCSIDATYLYVGFGGTVQRVMKILLSNFATTTSLYINNASWLTSCINDATYIYFGKAATPGIIWRVAKSDFSTVAMKTFAAGEGDIYGLTHDATYVYVACASSPAKVIRLLKSDFSTYNTKTLDAGNNHARGCVAATDDVYFGCDDRIVKVSKSDWSTHTVVKTIAGTSFRMSADSLFVSAPTYVVSSVVERVMIDTADYHIDRDFGAGATKDLSSINALEIWIKTSKVLTLDFILGETTPPTEGSLIVTQANVWQKHSIDITFLTPEQRNAIRYLRIGINPSVTLTEDVTILIDEVRTNIPAGKYFERDFGAGSELDLSVYDDLVKWLKSSVTGNYLVSFGEAAGDEQTYEVSLAADVWTQITWPISAIADADRNLVRYMRITPNFESTVDYTLLVDDINTGADTTGESRVYVYDVTEGQWYLYVFAYAITAACVFSQFMKEDTLYLGGKTSTANTGTLIKLDETVGTDLGVAFTTEFVLGPFQFEARELKMKSLHINADPKRNFNLNVYGRSDQTAEKHLTDTATIPFVVGNQVSKKIRLKRIRGQNVALRITTTDKIDELQGMMPTLIPKGVK